MNYFDEKAAHRAAVQERKRELTRKGERINREIAELKEAQTQIIEALEIWRNVPPHSEAAIDSACNVIDALRKAAPFLDEGTASGIMGQFTGFAMARYAEAQTATS